MKFLQGFIDAYTFQEMSGQYFGICNDMHMVLMKENAEYCAYLYLDLPPAGRKARKDLVSQMNERGARYGVCVHDSQEKNRFLKISLRADADAASNLERFMLESDLLLRPYGREMGMLCAYCRKEMQEEKPVFKTDNGIVVPVCPACAGLESASKAKKADNRRTADRKRVIKGVFGALIGCVISAVFWMFAGFTGGILTQIIAAFLSVFLIKWLYEKMSRMPSRLTPVMILAFSLFALLLGSAFGHTMKVNEYREYMRSEAEYMELFPEEANEENSAYWEQIIHEMKNGEFEDITVFQAFLDPAYYKKNIFSVLAVVIASLGADSQHSKFRKRR